MAELYIYTYTYIFIYLTTSLSIHPLMDNKFFKLFLKGENKFIKEFVEPFIYCRTFDNKYSFNIKYTETLIISLFSKFNM